MVKTQRDHTVERIEGMKALLRLASEAAHGLAQELGYDASTTMRIEPLVGTQEGRVMGDVAFDLYKCAQRIDELLKALDA